MVFHLPTFLQNPGDPLEIYSLIETYGVPTTMYPLVCFLGAYVLYMENFTGTVRDLLLWVIFCISVGNCPATRLIGEALYLFLGVHGHLFLSLFTASFTAAVM